MNVANYESFQLLDTTYKASKGCKGIGRLLWLKEFSLVKINSVFKSDDGLHHRSFFFSNQGISESLLNDCDGTSEIGTSVELCSIKNEYYDSKATPKYPVKTKFHNFEQNSEGDFDELERLLLDN